MEEQFCDYEISLKLKELGFDEECFAHYCKGDLITQRAILKSSSMQYYQQNNINPNNQYKHLNCTAPLWQQAQSFLDKNYTLLVIIKYDNTYGYQWDIRGKKNKPLYRCAVTYQTLYDARKQSILKAIELCQKED